MFYDQISLQARIKKITIKVSRLTNQIILKKKFGSKDHVLAYNGPGPLTLQLTKGSKWGDLYKIGGGKMPEKIIGVPHHCIKSPRTSVPSMIVESQ